MAKPATSALTLRVPDELIKKAEELAEINQSSRHNELVNALKRGLK